MAKLKSNDKKIVNTRARFDYELGDSFVMGIVLNGRETKALRLGHGQLQGAFVAVKNGELFLMNTTIHGTNGIPIDEQEKTQDRKLLAKKREIAQLIAAKQQGKTIVPTELLTKGRFIKVRVAIGKGKREYDKRQTIKKQDDRRNIAKDLRRNFK